MRVFYNTSIKPITDFLFQLKPRIGRLLVIEDDPAILLTLTVYLESAGFEVIQAPALSAAEISLKSEEIDIVLLDLGLTDSPIPEETIKKIPTFPKPVIVLTAHCEQELLAAAAEQGAAGVIFKPEAAIDDLLLRTIERVIEHKPKYEALQKSTENLDRIEEKIQQLTNGTSNGH